MVDRRTKHPGGLNNAGGEEVSARFDALVERWMAEDPAYDGEAWPELKEALDRNRPEYRKLFPNDQPKASED